MQDVQKAIIRFALDYSIVDIHTYSGYKGDLVVRITVKDKDDVLAIRRFALESEIKEVIIKEKKDVVQYDVYCITEDENVYHIKDDNILDDAHVKYLDKGVWIHKELK